MSLSPLASQTPGVYIDEINASPNSISPIATAIPAFVGYTPKAEYDGKSCLNRPVKINSFSEFKAFFLLPDPPAPASPAQQYSPQYYITQVEKKPETGASHVINGERYTIEPDPGTVYYLYNSLRLFFENGGGTAYIVSVGGFGKPTGSPIQPGSEIENPNVQFSELKTGLKALAKIPEVTMYIVPDATLLSRGNNQTLMEGMLLQCSQMKTAISILDIIGGRAPDPVLYTQDIENFRNSTGTNGLDYGTSYYPFLETTISQSGDIDFTNINGGDLNVLESIVNPESEPNATANHLLHEMKSFSATTNMNQTQLNQAMINVSMSYAGLMDTILAKVNVLPPSGAMAGVYTLLDQTRGVWKAPANVALIAVTGLTLAIDNEMQQDLNVDPVSGKSINPIRFFNGKGILVWGARTLDGNSQDWRYINVRRTLIMIEQTIKLAVEAYRFTPNDKNTWVAVESMINNFLMNIWKEGALVGAKPADAFQVDIGLGSTMTAEDIESGFMNITVRLAIVRPAEFIVITIQQAMAEHK